jgi:hypothetical protein
VAQQCQSPVAIVDAEVVQTGGAARGAGAGERERVSGRGEGAGERTQRTGQRDGPIALFDIAAAGLLQ